MKLHPLPPISCLQPLNVSVLCFSCRRYHVQLIVVTSLWMTTLSCKFSFFMCEENKYSQNFPRLETETMLPSLMTTVMSWWRWWQQWLKMYHQCLSQCFCKLSFDIEHCLRKEKQMVQNFRICEIARSTVLQPNFSLTTTSVIINCPLLINWSSVTRRQCLFQVS